MNPKHRVEHLISTGCDFIIITSVSRLLTLAQQGHISGSKKNLRSKITTLFIGGDYGKSATFGSVFPPVQACDTGGR